MRSPLALHETPRRSPIPLRLIIRLGATMSSFISASRSVPPARISLWPQVSLSRVMAWLLRLGLTYSNGRICGRNSLLSDLRDGLANSIIRFAAAEVAAKAATNLFGRRLRMLVEKSRAGDDKAGRAETALSSIVIDKGLL